MEITTAAAVVVFLAIVIGITFAIVIWKQEIQSWQFKKEIQRIRAERRSVLGQEPVDSVKARAIVTLAAVNAQNAVAEKRLALCDGRSGALFDAQQRLLSIYKKAIDNLTGLGLAEPEMALHRQDLEESLKGLFRSI